ncbi:MAG: FAD-binding protein, partial [Acidobacteriaceae bacterium]|nr:FAD-binding protein [Acidobacteriaceae bacterium]
LVDRSKLQHCLPSSISGEVWFDPLTRALYSTDASVYQIEPLGVVIPKSRDDVVEIVRTCHALRCPLTVRGGGTSQAGQAVGEGLQVDTSKYLNRILEIDQEHRWARVEPGVVLSELNAELQPFGLRFAPDISTANRATIGGMMGNNAAGARSVLYGKTIDHVLEQTVVLADASIAHFRALAGEELECACRGETLEAAAYRVLRNVAGKNADEIDRRFPKLMRRVGGYNLDRFIRSDRSFNLVDLMVGSEGTLGVVVEAKIKLVPLPRAKAVLVIEFDDLLEALGATPAILQHQPSAVEVMDDLILRNTKENAALQTLRKNFIEGEPGGLLCVEFYADAQQELPPKLSALEEELKSRGWGQRFFHAYDSALQSQIWSLREAALGLSMAMKGDAKSISFVEDTAVAPEHLREYIARFLDIVRRNGTEAGVYAHASVGCLHVRPVVNLKTETGIRQFEAIANQVADLVLEYGGALSGEHGDGLVRSSFMARVYGETIYEAFREIKRTFDPVGILNPGKIVDAPPLTNNLRFGPAYRTKNPRTFFDYSEYGGMTRAAEMCSGVGACRKKLEGTMCPSYIATRDEKDTTRGRANVLRLAMSGHFADAQLSDRACFDVLDLCLECRACKSECPVGVDMARLKSEFLASYWERNGVERQARMLGHVHNFAKWGSRFAPISNWVIGTGVVRRINEKYLVIDPRRKLPQWSRRTLAQSFRARTKPFRPDAANVLLFNDTFTNYYNPEIGIAAVDILEAAGLKVGLASNRCCGRALISKGLLAAARALAASNTALLYEDAVRGRPILFCEPSCLSAMREDAAGLIRGPEREKAEIVAKSCLLFEEFLDREWGNGRVRLNLTTCNKKVLLHGHCHQKSMGLLQPAKALLARIPGSQVIDLDAGCCGMAGSFGYSREHYEVSRLIGERRLFPAARNSGPDSVLVAAGVSCRQQVEDFTGLRPVHPAVLLRSLLSNSAQSQIATNDVLGSS